MQVLVPLWVRFGAIACKRCNNWYEEVPERKFTLESCVQVLRPIAERMEAMGPEDKQSLKLDDNALTAVQTRHVTTIYGEQGATVMDLLRKNPCVAVPVIMLRLEQKGHEWNKVRLSERHSQKTYFWSAPGRRCLNIITRAYHTVPR